MDLWPLGHRRSLPWSVSWHGAHSLAGLSLLLEKEDMGKKRTFTSQAHRQSCQICLWIHTKAYQKGLFSF